MATASSKRGAQGVDHVHLGGLGHDADRLGPRLDQLSQRLVLGRLHAGPAGGAEGHQGGGPERQLDRCPLEELGVLRVGSRPSPLDEGHAQMVELLGDPELVVDGQREALLLGAVAQGGVEDVHRFGQDGELEVVAPRRPAVGVDGGTPVGMGPLSGRAGRLVGAGRPVMMVGAGPVAVALTGGGRRAAPGRVVRQGRPLTRHSPTSPCTGRLHPGRWRSRSAGSRG